MIKPSTIYLTSTLLSALDTLSYLNCRSRPMRWVPLSLHFIGPTVLKSRSQSHVPSGSSRGTPLPCLLQLLEASHILGSWPLLCIIPTSSHPSLTLTFLHSSHKHPMMTLDPPGQPRILPISRALT